MSTQIQAEHFTDALYTLLDETFDNVQGYYLDKGTSLFETLATISAEEASVPVGGKCATLAAQVKHVAFYLDVLERSRASRNRIRTAGLGQRSGVRRPRSRRRVGRRAQNATAREHTTVIKRTHQRYDRVAE